MKHALLGSVALVVLSALLAGCQSPPARPRAETTVSETTRNNCYSLLYQLLGDEKNVSKLRFIKREDSDVKQLLIKISDAARKAHTELEAFSKLDPSLQLNAVNLPPGEDKTRQDISAVTEKQLLHESGEKLELDLLLTQIDALRYAAHLAKVAGQNDFNSERAQYLARLSQQMQSLHDEAVAFLTLRHPGK